MQLSLNSFFELIRKHYLTNYRNRNKNLEVLQNNIISKKSLYRNFITDDTTDDALKKFSKHIARVEKDFAENENKLKQFAIKVSNSIKLHEEIMPFKKLFMTTSPFNLIDFNNHDCDHIQDFTLTILKYCCGIHKINNTYPNIDMISQLATEKKDILIYMYILNQEVSFNCTTLNCSNKNIDFLIDNLYIYKKNDFYYLNERVKLFLNDYCLKIFRYQKILPNFLNNFIDNISLVNAKQTLVFLQNCLEKVSLDESTSYFYIKTAKVLFNYSLYPLSLKFYIKLLCYLKKADKKQIVLIKIINNIAVIAEKTENYLYALEIYNMLINWLENDKATLKTKKYLFRIYNNLAMIHTHCDCYYNLNHAENNLKKSIELNITSNDFEKSLDYIGYLNNKACIKAYYGDYKQSLDILSEARNKLLLKNENTLVRIKLSIVYTNIAICHMLQQNNFHISKYYFSLAKTTYEQICNSNISYAKLNRIIALIYFSYGEYFEALKHLHEALKICLKYTNNNKHFFNGLQDEILIIYEYLDDQAKQLILPKKTKEIDFNIEIKNDLIDAVNFIKTLNDTIMTNIFYDKISDSDDKSSMETNWETIKIIIK